MPKIILFILAISGLWILLSCRAQFKALFRFKDYILQIALKCIPLPCFLALKFLPEVSFFALSLWTFSLFLLVGLWPFQRLLLNTSNSSLLTLSLIHSIIIPSELLFLIQAAPFFEMTPYLLGIIEVFGALSFVLGLLWKLVSANIRNSLCCSTIASSGLILFLFGAQCYQSALVLVALQALWSSFCWLHANSAIEKKARPSFVLKTKWGQRLYVSLLNQSKPTQLNPLRRNISL